MRVQCHQLEMSKVETGRRVKGLVVWPLVGGAWAGAEVEGVFGVRVHAGRGLAGHGVWQEAGWVAWEILPVVRIDPATNPLRIMGTGFLDCLYICNKVTNTERERNLNKFWVIGLDLEVSR